MERKTSRFKFRLKERLIDRAFHCLSSVWNVSFQSKNEQHLPRRTREILKELPLKETGRGAISIADLKDAEGKTFYHNLFWSNFRGALQNKEAKSRKHDLDQSQVEIDRLAAAFEIIVGSLKMNDADWEIEDGEGNTLADTLLESELFSKAAYRAIKEKSGRVTLCSLKTFLKLLSGGNKTCRTRTRSIW